MVMKLSDADLTQVNGQASSSTCFIQFSQAPHFTNRDVEAPRRGGIQIQPGSQSWKVPKPLGLKIECDSRALWVLGTGSIYIERFGC